ncbi:MAG: hypothetical protein E7311_05890 [Clostridiales bacterium]|nr:hypothetical protein [Clostridiales bacterium]
MALKENDEITVKINVDIEEFYKILKVKGYNIVNKFTMDDSYFIPNNLDISNMSIRDILSKAILTRYIVDNIPNDKIYQMITYKKKDITPEGVILGQESINCYVENIEQAKKLIKAIGYIEIMNIKENDLVYEKDGIQLCIKDIIDGDNLVEVETKYNEEYNTVEKIKEKLIKENLPIDLKNLYIKKAEIELNKRLKREG